MHNNPNTGHENPSIDAEDWEIALEPYFAHPDAALGLARLFAAMRAYLKSTPPDVPQALDALTFAIEALYQHTQFQSGSYELYETVIEGRASKTHETLAESLGVKL